MRVMVMIKATPASESDHLPSAELLEAMGRYNEELTEARILVAGEGPRPSSQGARVRVHGSERTVIERPFPNTEQLVAGFWLWQVVDGGGGRLGQALPEPDGGPRGDRGPADGRARGLRRERHPRGARAQRAAACSQLARAGSGLDEAPSDRVTRQVDPVADPELLEDVRAVALDRLLADHEDLGDLLAGVSLGD